MSKIDYSKVQWYSRSRSSEVGPTVSINKSGRVVLNNETLGLFGENQPEAFQVGIVPGSRGKVTLVLQAAAKGDVGALALSKQGTSKSSLNTTKWLKDQGLERIFEQSDNPEFDPEHNALVVSL